MHSADQLNTQGASLLASTPIHPPTKDESIAGLETFLTGRGFKVTPEAIKFGDETILTKSPGGYWEILDHQDFAAMGALYSDRAFIREMQAHRPALTAFAQELVAQRLSQLPAPDMPGGPDTVSRPSPVNGQKP